MQAVLCEPIWSSNSVRFPVVAFCPPFHLSLFLAWIEGGNQLFLDYAFFFYDSLEYFCLLLNKKILCLKIFFFTKFFFEKSLVLENDFKKV